MEFNSAFKGLKTQCVPRSKHSPSGPYKQISYSRIGKYALRVLTSVKRT